MEKLMSIIMLVLIMASFMGYLGAVMSSTLAFSHSENMSEVAEKTIEEKSEGKPLFPIPMGDPINDPKPNGK